MTIERIETSCPCLTATPAPIRVGPHERIALAINFDSSSDHDFAGRLSIAITAYARAEVAFRTFARVELLSESSKSGAEESSSSTEEHHP